MFKSVGSVFIYLLTASFVFLGAATAYAGSDSIYYINTLTLFKFDEKNVCSIVKVHSLYKDAEGRSLHQEGVGWVVSTPRYFGILTPFHVVTQADNVIAQCGDRYFALAKPAIDAERDLAVFKVDATYEEVVDVLNPLLLAVEKSDDSFAKVAKSNPVAAMGMQKKWVYAVPQSDYRNYLEPIMLTMTNFNVVSPADRSRDQNSMLASPIGYGHVQGYSVRDQSYIDNLIRIPNFGIRPGLSGAPLIGVPYTMENYRQGQYSLPVELTPRVVLGMVTKTRLNGAETVAISLTDIIDFLEEYNSDKTKFYPQNRTLEVRYRPIKSQKQGQLQSYIQLHSPTAGEMPVFEYCSSDYLVSANTTPTQNRKLEQALKVKEFSQPDKNLLSNGNPNKKSSLAVPKKIEQQKSGGGEYGEGGDGFLTAQSEFLTSRTTLGDFNSSLKSGWDLVSQTSSFGLYISPMDCKSRGLHLDSKVIHGVQVPGEKVARLLTFEDLRRFHKSHGDKTLDLLLRHGFGSREPFFTSELKGLNLSVPMVNLQNFNSDDKNWNPGNKAYFKQLIQPSRKTDPVKYIVPLNPFKAQQQNDFKPGEVLTPEGRFIRQEDAVGSLEISDKFFSLRTALFLPKTLSDPRFENYFSIRYFAGKWQASLAAGRSCRIEMSSANFTQANPWSLEYNDGGTKLSIDFMNHNRFMLVNIQKANCPELKDLALGEIEIYLSGDLMQTSGNGRGYSLSQEKIDWDQLAEKFSKRGGTK